MRHGTYWRIAPGQENVVESVHAYWGEAEATDTYSVPLRTIEQELSDEEDVGETWESVRFFQPQLKTGEA